MPPNLSLSSFLVQGQSTRTPLQPVEHQVEVTRQRETLQEMEEKLEKRCGLMDEEMKKSRDAWKMEEERELFMKEMDQVRERLRKEEDKVGEIKKSYKISYK